jgi:hypothetical protein
MIKAGRWLMPVILATQEAEIRRIEVQSQPREIVQEALSWKTLQKNGHQCLCQESLKW